MTRFHAHGTTVEFASATVGQLTTITLPDRSRGDVQITVGESGFDHEFIPGIRDNGTFSIEFVLDVDDTGQQALRTNFESDQDLATVFVTLPARATSNTSVVYRFRGYVQSFPEGELPQESADPASASATIKVSGGVTQTIS